MAKKLRRGHSLREPGLVFVVPSLIDDAVEDNPGGVINDFNLPLSWNEIAGVGAGALGCEAKCAVAAGSPCPVLMDHSGKIDLPDALPRLAVLRN